jgi:uncharacterized protein (DUF4415 family)
MAKKLSVLSRPDRLVRVNSDDIFDKPLTRQQRAVVKRLAARQAAGDDSHIDYSDIPPLTEGQLARMVRARDVAPAKIPVSVRLDPRVLAWLKSKGQGHLTRINDILANVMEAERRVQSKSS